MVHRRVGIVSAGLCFALTLPAVAQEAPPPPVFPSSPPPRVQPVALPKANPGSGARPWSTQLKSGWNLVSIPGTPEGPLAGLNYSLVDASSNQPLAGAPSPWRAYWAYSDGDSLLSAPVAPVSTPPTISLREGWNALSSPLNHAEGLANIGEGQTYGQAFTGELGNFHSLPFQSGFNMQPGQVVWVYAYRPSEIGLQSTSLPVAGSGIRLNSPWTVQGRVLDDRGQPLKADISLKGDFGRVTTSSDGAGHFSAAIPGLSTQARSVSFAMRVSSLYHDAWRRTVTLPLQAPISVTLPNQSATLWVSAYSYKWGKADYRPYSIVIYEYGNYHKRRTSWFPQYGPGRTDTSIKYFPQGRPYRMIVTWCDRRGNQQTLTRDGTITSSYQTFHLWNSWTYN